jgi:hypothetical protein
MHEVVVELERKRYRGDRRSRFGTGDQNLCFERFAVAPSLLRSGLH